MNNILHKYTWFIRRRFYKIRLFWKASKAFYAPWECVDMLVTFNFELLCEFYENGGIDTINWDSDDYHKQAKNDMDNLYTYWKKERKEKQEEIDYLLDEWSKHNVSWFGPYQEDSEYDEYNSVCSKYGNYLFKLLDQCEEEFRKKEEENLICLIKIKNFLWT
jgi:hypothetical protein